MGQSYDIQFAGRLDRTVPADVFEVDGNPVRDRQERLTRLFNDSSAAGSDRMAAIINESARYNIGDIVRTVNTPLMPLLFLDPEHQPRFKFTMAAM